MEKKTSNEGDKRGRQNKGRGQMAEVKGYREKEEEDLPANRIVQFLPAQFRL